MPAPVGIPAGGGRVYIGTYTGAGGQGIYQARFDPASGRLSAPELAAETSSPIYLALHPRGRVLYAVSHAGVDQVGAVEAYAIEPGGKLSLLNRQTSAGVCPCHLAVDPTGQCLLVANYLSGSIAALPIAADGRLGEPGTVLQHRGSSTHPRQAGPHAHSITPDPAGRFALACDLGVDQVLVYRLDPGRAALEPNAPPAMAVSPGAGPRHLAFHPGGRRVYLINELASTLAVLDYDPLAGGLKEVQSITTLPARFAGDNTGAHVLVHPSGSFVYASNRGHDSIAVFAVADHSGELSLIGHQHTQGKSPRHFAIDPSGSWLLAANQGSDSIVALRVDHRTGRLTPTGQAVTVASPVCVLFGP